MQLKRISVGKNINLTLIEEKKFNTDFLSINFLMPLKKETAAKNALLPAVLKRGTVNYPTIDAINKRLEYLYASSISGRNYKRGEVQVFGFTSNMLNNSVVPQNEDIQSQVLDLLKEVVFAPKLENGIFSEEYVNSEKRRMCAGIASKINDKGYYSSVRCLEEMCKNEAFGISETGSIEDVEAITAADLYAHYQNVLKTATVEIFFVGKFNEKEITERITDMFKGIERGECEALSTEVISEVKEVRHIEEYDDITQGKLNIGFRMGTVLGDADMYAMHVAISVFGAGTTCKLFMNVREKMSLCYYCAASPNFSKGIMTVASGVEAKNKAITEEQILVQLKSVQDGDITDDEMKNAKLSLINGIKSATDRSSSIEGWYFGRIMSGIEETMEESIAKINAVTKEDVQNAAKKIVADTYYFLAPKA